MSQSVSEQLLGSSVLKAPGLNTCDILAAVADYYNGTVDLSHICIENDSGRIARLYDGVYHSEKGVDDHTDEKLERWLELGEDSDQEWKEAVEKALDNMTKSGISNSGRTELEELLREFHNTIRV